MRPRHKNGGRYPFICYITNEYAKFTIIQFKHIVKIAANLTRRKNTTAKVVTRVGWQNVWKDRHLNIGSHLEFPFEALFFYQEFLGSLKLIKGFLQLPVLLSQVAEGGNVGIIQT